MDSRSAAILARLHASEAKPAPLCQFIYPDGHQCTHPAKRASKGRRFHHKQMASKPPEIDTKASGE